MGGHYLHCASCVIASQYATSTVNRCWSGFPCKWQYINVETLTLNLGTDKPKLKVKMQSVSDNNVRKRLLEKPRFEPMVKVVFRLGRCYIFWQGIPGLWTRNRESMHAVTNAFKGCMFETSCPNRMAH